MAAERWPRVKEILAATLDASPERRSSLLDELCAGDASLREEVASLLEAHERSTSFLEAPIAAAIPLEDQEPNIGRRLGPYVVESAIGRGGMGTVYLARRADDEFERKVAVKMIRRGMDSELVIRRFRHERQILASLEHPNIAALFDGGTTADGLPYFVMEYVAGTPIDKYADAHCLPTPARIALCLPVIDAVQHAHERSIVHRDIKPTNVMVTAEGHPKLLDFGIAKILDAEGGNATFTSVARPMTPDYASPEQLRGDPITPASDVYALGVLLYEVLTGHHPYRIVTHTPEAIARMLTEQEPERPSKAIERVETVALDDGSSVTTDAETVSRTRDGSPASLRQKLSGTLDEILLKALRKEPDQRYASAAALSADLRRYLSEEPVDVSWDGRRYRARRFAVRYRSAALVALLVAAVAGATMALARSRWFARPAAAPAQAQAASRPSVAVIGFRNLSPRPADDWLSTAMAEMLTTELGGDGQLRVLPAERVARVRGDVDRTSDRALSPETVERVRTALASDYAVTGTVAIADGATPRAIRIDVRVDRARAGEAGMEPIAVAGTGDEAQLFTLVANVGKALRAQLGLHDSTDETTRSVRAAFPRTLEATRLYAEGLARLRLLDAVAARDLLERAAAREDANPMIEAALASAWTALGYDARAAAAAQKAFDASAALNREERLNVEGRLQEARRRWPNAIDVYRTLWGFFSDNIEYGLRLAAAQTAGGQGSEALKTIEAMRRLPPPQGLDARIDLQAAQTAAALGDFLKETAALQQALAHANGSRLIVARVRLLEGRNLYNRGQLGAAEQSLNEAQRVFLEVGDRASAATALNSLGAVLGDQQDLSRAERMYEQSLAVSEEIGDRRGMAAALNNLGVLYKDRRRYDDARRVHERALTLRREVADQQLVATSLANIGVVFFEQDRFAEATERYRQALAISREIGDRRGQVRALHNMAIIDRQLGRLAAARAGYEESLATRAAIGDKRGTVIGQVELGMVLLAQAELDRARQTEESAMTLAREVRLRPGESQALYQLGEIALASGDLAAARRLHEQAMAIRQEMKEARTVLESRLAMAVLLIEEGRPEDAEREARALADTPGTQSDDTFQLNLAVLLVRARLAAGDTASAAKEIARARTLASKTDQIEVRRMLTLVEADLDVAQGRPERARERLTNLRASLAKSGMVLGELESRAALLRIDRLQGRSTFRADAAALRKDAEAHGAKLLLRSLG